MINTQLLEKLCKAHGVNGDTSMVRSVLAEELKALGVAFDTHPYGSLYFGNSTNPKKMIVAHMDEVGFQISHIQADGLLKVMPAGWVFPNRLDHIVVYIHNGSNFIPGIVLHHEVLKTENLTDFDSLSIDIGVESAEEVAALGIRVGMFGSFQKNYHETDKAVIASSVDNRISQYAVLELIKENKDLLQDNLFVFHVDEETQDHNARGLCHLYKPDLTVVLDYCPQHQKKINGDQLGGVGKGPLVMYRGGSYVLHERARAYFDLDIKTPFQKGFLSAETLPSLEPAFYEENTHTVAVNVCIPANGYHGQAYSVRKADVEAYKNLINEILTVPFNR